MKNVLIDFRMADFFFAGAEPQYRHIPGYDAGAAGVGGGDSHYRGGPWYPNLPRLGGHL